MRRDAVTPVKDGVGGFFDLPPNWDEYWQGMPTFNQKDLGPFRSVVVHFRNPEDCRVFAELVGNKITKDTKYVWFPRQKIVSGVDMHFDASPRLSPRYPVYVISKGRWKTPLTARALEYMRIPYHIVVEPQEYDEYASVIDEEKILTLPFSNLGQGSIPARNWVWEHSLESKALRHWILDDNIYAFKRLYNNIKRRVVCGNMFRAAEDFVDRYENVAISGFHYFMFVPRKELVPPLYLNTRVYSCILIKNDIPYRWRGRYNEDTDLCLRALKDGWCTVLFNAFLAQKMPTMTMKGGNTEELYRGDGRYEMAKSLLDQHPDVVSITRRWGRWQHFVDYHRFRNNKLIPKFTGAEISAYKGQNEYGMYLVGGHYLGKEIKRKEEEEGEDSED